MRSDGSVWWRGIYHSLCRSDILSLTIRYAVYFKYSRVYNQFCDFEYFPSRFSVVYDLPEITFLKLNHVFTFQMLYPCFSKS